MKFSEQKNLVADLRALADFYERPESIILPKLYLNDYFAIKEGDYKDEEVVVDGTPTTRWQFVIDLDKTKKRMKQIARALGSCEKKWDDGEFRVIKRISKRVSLTFYADREAFCEKVQVDTRIIPAQEEKIVPAVPEREEPVYEWRCTDPILLS